MAQLLRLEASDYRALQQITRKQYFDIYLIGQENLFSRSYGRLYCFVRIFCYMSFMTLQRVLNQPEYSAEAQ